MGIHAILLTILVCLFSGYALQDAEDGVPDFPVLKGPYFGQSPPGNEPLLFAPGIVSTGKEHSAAMFIPGGNEMWFGRMFPAAIWCSQIKGGQWTQPVVAPFCDEWGELYPVLSPDGKQLFYTSTRPITARGEPRRRGSGHIWMVEREDENWSEPRYLGDRVNFADRHSCGSVAADGTLYFTGKRVNTSVDIFEVAAGDNGYKEPRKISSLDSQAPDHSPFVSPDQNYIIISSFRSGLGRSDLFISFRRPDSAWTTPLNMGPAINSQWKDEYPFVSPDGKYLFFNSNRPSEINDSPIPDGPGNIYWVDAGIIDRLRSQVLEY